jgi:branched-chain amino acid transport system ATP-binding protein
VSEPPLLEVEGLNAGYGRSQVLFGISLAVPRSGVVAVLGRNGAGKSSLLKTLAGELRASGGSIRFDGEAAADLPTEGRIRRGLGYVPQEHAVFGKLTVRENLLLGTLAAAQRPPLDEVLELFPKLGQRLGQTAGTLSGGERKMLAIGRALLGRPRLLMLDEPTEGVWIGVIEEIAERLVELSRTMALLLVEQHVHLALRLSRHAYVLGRGEVVLEGPADAVRDDPQLIRYLSP